MSKTLLPLAALLALAGPAAAQAPANAAPTFPFVLPWDDAAPGTVTDVSFLNAKPAGVYGYIVPRDGHFVEGKTGKRVRFLAINFAARSAFPSHADAEKVAARIAKLGINLVRMHHLDNNWGDASGTLIDSGFPDHQHLSPTQLDKVDYLFAQLKKNGVYANVNLHVSRTFTPDDGFPASVSQIPFDFDKRVDEFDRRMIQLDKNYAHDLLTHVNPYTGLSYADDPAVAVVEINNENSLVGDPWATPGAGLNALPAPFRGELVGFWNDWLLKKYGTDAGVQAAWTRGLTPTGPGMLAQAAPWSIEHQETSLADMTPMPRLADLSLTGAPAVEVHVTQTDGTDWHVQVHQTGLDLHEGATYTVTFRAKADAPRPLPLGASLDQADWHNVGLTASVAPTTDWKTFSYVFTAHDTVSSHNRLAFTLGGQTGSVWISDLQIHPGAEGAGLPPGQSLATKTVDIPNATLKIQHEDWITFLADTERSYAEEMRAYLKNDLHVHANVICSQVSWGGLTGLGREASMDFADNHAYWQHPSFPHKPWDPKDWTIPNTPMVTDLASGGGGTLRDLAEYRVAGKPYSVSEYNHPAPSDYRAEMMPELATFAAFQDWDALTLFDYGDYGTSAQNDKINGFFGIGSDPAKAAFLPAAAMIFRAGELPTATGIHELLFSPAQTVSISKASDAWKNVYKGQELFLFSYLIAVGLRPAGQADASIESVIGDGAYPLRTRDTLEYPDIPQVTTSKSGAQYMAAGASAYCLAGYVGGTTADVNALLYRVKNRPNVDVTVASFTFPTFGNNFAAMTLTAMDQKPIPQSRRLLLTLVGKVENQGMGWNADRASVGDQWGHGPVMAEGVPATVSLKTDGGARHVWALDSTGKRATEVPATYAKGVLTFTVGPQFKTLWYEVGG